MVRVVKTKLEAWIRGDCDWHTTQVLFMFTGETNFYLFCHMVLFVSCLSQIILILNGTGTQPNFPVLLWSTSYMSLIIAMAI